MRTTADSLVGRVLDARYTVTSRIARGGMATVYLAMDNRLDREVAVKVMHPHLADDEQFVARFHREAKAAARMSHPNVVSVFDQGADDEIVYLVMEHVPGTTLRDLLNERSALTPGEALSVLEPLLDALAAAHRAGVVHRDVKPENVLLTDDGRVKVADFGLARAATTSQTGTTTGMLMGTAAYLSPELVLRGVADARADVYAAGILLFEMLTGRQPFTGEVPVQVAYQHVHAEVPAPSTLDPGLPVELDELVLWSTARDPDERPRDARELVHEVRAVRAAMSEPVLDRPPQAVPAGASAARVGAGDLDPTPTDSHLPTRVVRPGVSHPGDVHDHVAALPVGDPADPGDTGTGPARGEYGWGPGGGRRRRGLWALVLLLVLATGLGAVGWYLTAGPGAYTETPAVGDTVEQASSDLRAAGLVPEVQERYSETVAAGTVIDTDPGAGDRIRKGATVDVNVSVGSEFTVVGELAGLDVEAATGALEALDLVLGDDPDTEFSETVPEGTVIRQEPAAGTEIRRGDAVAVVVSAGRQPIEVPSVTGDSRADAVAAIEEAGLVVGVTEAFSDTVGAGIVTSQDPAEGTLFRGDTVSVVVSKGPPLVQVPDVVGEQVGAATQTLEAAGFTVEEERVLGGFFGTVRQQDPEGGTSVPPGSVVTLTIV